MLSSIKNMSERKKTWMKQNYTWMQKWNIYLNPCPTNSKELKNFVMEKSCKRVWGKELGGKKKYYIEEFNHTYDLQQKEFIGASILWRANVLIAQLRTNPRQIRCERGRWKRPKEAREEQLYTILHVWGSGIRETFHFEM